MASVFRIRIDQVDEVLPDHSLKRLQREQIISVEKQNLKNQVDDILAR